MLTIFRKELTAFFSSLIGYIAIAVFLILVGLVMWVFPNNAFDFGFANLDILFTNAPMVFMLLIPAVTMRLFSEEKKAGTLEIIATRPVTELQIILGKYFAALVLVIVALLPTFLYFYAMYDLTLPLGALNINAIITRVIHEGIGLAFPKGNLDAGAIWGSYLGLILLSAVFVSIGVFGSALTDNQIVAFILSAFLCFVFYLAFNALSGLGLFGGKVDDIIQSIGIQYHYESISRGVVDSRDAIYFLSLILIFLLSTKTALESRKW